MRKAKKKRQGKLIRDNSKNRETKMFFARSKRYVDFNYIINNIMQLN